MYPARSTPDVTALAMHLTGCGQGIAPLANDFHDAKFLQQEMRDDLHRQAVFVAKVIRLTLPETTPRRYCL